MIKSGQAQNAHQIAGARVAAVIGDKPAHDGLMLWSRQIFAEPKPLKLRERRDTRLDHERGRDGKRPGPSMIVVLPNGADAGEILDRPGLAWSDRVDRNKNTGTAGIEAF